MGKWEQKRAIERQQWEPLLRSGVTMKQIAVQRGVCRQRIFQKLSTLGLLDLYHAIHGIKSAEKKAAQVSAADAKCYERWGCDLATRREMTQEKVGYAYSQQKRNAASRGVAWEMNLPEWWAIWKDSGMWKKRGKFKGQYCMSRFGDVGPYKIGNVAIVSNADNAREAKTHHQKANTTGVYCTMPGTSKPWVAYAKKKYIGYFATESEAEEARSRQLESSCA